MRIPGATSLEPMNEHDSVFLVDANRSFIPQIVFAIDVMFVIDCGVRITST